MLKKKLSQYLLHKLKIPVCVIYKQMLYWESQGPRSQLLSLIRPQFFIFGNVCFAFL